MSERMGQMELMIEKLNSKIVLLETQMKINENNHASLSGMIFILYEEFAFGLCVLVTYIQLFEKSDLNAKICE
jgi:hypothetical protein